jgi:hypothetical protein
MVYILCICVLGRVGPGSGSAVGPPNPTQPNPTDPDLINCKIRREAEGSERSSGAFTVGTHP